MYLDRKLAPGSGFFPTGFVRSSFSGRAGEFLRLLVLGSFLQILTLGFYRFWLLTDIRRHLWSNTRIGDDAFEYTGTPKELLIGFLIALAVLAPIYVVYFWLGVEAEQLQGFASVPLFFLLYVLGQYARFRARRYRATRTIFRGVRFWMTGSAWGYAGRVVLYDLLTLLTFGLLYPWRTAALQRYLMRNTRYGDLAGAFDSTGWALFRRAGWIWLAAIAIPVGAVAHIVSTDWKGFAAARSDSLDRAALVVGLALLALALLFPLFRAIEMKWYLEGMRFGPIGVDTSLRKRAVVWCYVKTVLVALIYALFVAMLSGAAGYNLRGYGATIAAGKANVAVAGALAALAYLVVLLGFGVIKRLCLDRGLWVLAAGSLTVSGTAALDEVTARGEAAGSLGEGMADALDVGGF